VYGDLGVVIEPPAANSAALAIRNNVPSNAKTRHDPHNRSTRLRLT
jgi:hypothetical protein